MRIDAYLTQNKLAGSRERSKELIKNGGVKINGKVCTKPAYDVSDSDNVEVIGEEIGYVGRGGLKLAKAFEEFDIDVNEKVCADIGASTGGFTQCMLEHGAKLVYAVDVGHGQLHESLLSHHAVVNCEGVNARTLTKDFFEYTPEFMSVDLSFISLELVMPALANCLNDNSELAVLIKPQFEAGKSALNKKGIVKNPKEHIKLLDKVTNCFNSIQLDVKKLVPSAIKGGDGNIEYLAHLVKGGNSRYMEHLNLNEFVRLTFEQFRD